MHSQSVVNSKWYVIKKHFFILTNGGFWGRVALANSGLHLWEVQLQRATENFYNALNTFLAGGKPGIPQRRKFRAKWNAVSEVCRRRIPAGADLPSPDFEVLRDGSIVVSLREVRDFLQNADDHAQTYCSGEF